MERFDAVLAKSQDIDRVAAGFTANPFLTPAYAEAQQMLGLAPWVFRCGDGLSEPLATIGFIRSGRVGNILIFPSTVGAPAGSPFWQGLHHFIKRERVTQVELMTFAAPGVYPPPFADEVDRVSRREYLLNLQDAEFAKAFSTTHRRWVRKGLQQGLALRASSGDDALNDHLTLCDASTDRRRERGDATDRSGVDRASLAALLKTGSGIIYQALDNGVPVSTLFALRAASAGYLMGAGSSDAGRACGASHWLVSEVARVLRDQGMAQFNLGGARDEEAGLRAYKTAFGTTPVEMESVIARCGSRWRHTVISTADRLRQYAQTLRTFSVLQRRGA